MNYVIIVFLSDKTMTTRKKIANYSFLSKLIIQQNYFKIIKKKYMPLYLTPFYKQKFNISSVPKNWGGNVKIHNDLKVVLKIILFYTLIKHDLQT